jgi:hypothetical protein
VSLAYKREIEAVVQSAFLALANGLGERAVRDVHLTARNDSDRITRLEASLLRRND